MWERGLKLVISNVLSNVIRSLPVWERGLKPIVIRLFTWIGSRSPCGSVD